MAKEEPTPFTRVCAWTGDEFEGKGYILTTTDGDEIVSAAAFLAPWTVVATGDPEDDDQAPVDATSSDAPETKE